MSSRWNGERARAAAAMQGSLVGVTTLLCIAALWTWFDHVEREVTSGYIELRASAENWMCATMNDLFSAHALPLRANSASAATTTRNPMRESSQPASKPSAASPTRPE